MKVPSLVEEPCYKILHAYIRYTMFFSSNMRNIMSMSYIFELKLIEFYIFSFLFLLFVFVKAIVDDCLYMVNYGF